MSRTRVALLAGGVLVVAVVAVVAVYLGGSAPDAVGIDEAVDQVGSDDTPSSGDGSATDGDVDPDGAATGDADLAGTWTVDPSIGTFSVTESTGTFVGFRVDEVLSNAGEVEAIGRTPAVTGSLTLDGTTLTEAGFEADMTQLVSDRSQRDNRMRESLDTTGHPTATFALTEPVDLGAQPTEGEVVDVEAVGELTVAGVTQPVTVPLQAAVTEDVLVVTGSFPVTFADFGVTAPSAPIVVSVEDRGTVELQLFLTRD